MQQACKCVRALFRGKYGELQKGMNHLVKILAFRGIHCVEKMRKGWVTGETIHSTQVVFEKGLVMQDFQNKPTGAEYYRNTESTSASLLLSNGTNVLLSWARNICVCV